MKKIFKYQIFHLFGYIILGIIYIVYLIKFLKNNNNFFGLNIYTLFIFSWIIAGIFQTWILLFWRSELYFGKINKWFGKSGFLIYKIGFIILAIFRFLPILPISILTKNSLKINIILKYIILIAPIPLILWAIYSVFFYFGINRAFGADHFFKEYRTKSLEKRGTFKYIPNTMYTIILLLLYQPAILYGSFPGLFFALVHHIFIWFHYFCTEKPDMKEIYKN